MKGRMRGGIGDGGKGGEGEAGGLQWGNSYM